MKVQIRQCFGGLGGFDEFTRVVADYQHVEVSVDGLFAEAGANEIIIWAADPEFWLTIKPWAISVVDHLQEALPGKLADIALEVGKDAIIAAFSYVAASRKKRSSLEASSKFDKTDEMIAKLDRIAENLKDQNSGININHDNIVQIGLSGQEPLDRYRFQPKVEIVGGGVNKTTVAISAAIMAAEAEQLPDPDVIQGLKALLKQESMKACQQRLKDLEDPDNI